MSDVDALPVLFSTFEYLPRGCLPVLSWTCKALRSRAIDRAKEEFVDFGTVRVREGRWLLRYGASVIENPAARILTPRTLRIISTNPLAPQERYCRSVIEHPSLTVWLAGSALGFHMDCPQTPMKKYLLERLLSDNPEGFQRVFSNRFFANTNNTRYADTWDTDYFMFLLENTLSYFVAVCCVSFHVRRQTTEGLSELALRKGNHWFAACYNHVKHPIPDDVVRRLAKGNIDYCFSNSLPFEFVMQLLRYHYASDAFAAYLLSKRATVLQKAISQGHVPSVTLLTYLSRNAPTSYTRDFVHTLVSHQHGGLNSWVLTNNSNKRKGDADARCAKRQKSDS